MLLYFITFTPKCFAAFALAVAAVSAKPRAILQNETQHFTISEPLC